MTGYQVAAKEFPACGEISVGLTRAGVTGRVRSRQGVHAKAALAVCAHYLPVARAARLVAALTGVQVSARFIASIRGRAAGRLAPFMDRVRQLLRAVPVLYADETPARSAGKLHYVHVACTGFLTAMHTGDRTKEAIDAGGVLPGYAGTIVRDGYKGYEHLTDALHAWCGAHGLRDLAGLYRFDPDGQVWARSMADLLLDANATATAARAAGHDSLNDAQLARIRSWYRGAVAKGLADNTGKTSQIAKDGLTLARRFRACEDMILRFATDLAVGFTSNQAERDVRPVKVQQRTSGGTWRTLLGLADFAIVQSYLSTAAKWGIDALDALTRLFTDGPWLPQKVPQPVRPGRGNPGPCAGTADDIRHAGRGEPAMRRPQPHEHRRTGSLPRAAPGQPASHRLARVGRQRQDVAAAALAAHGDLALPPADVAQVQGGDLPGPQAQPRQQHQDREVAAAGRAVPVAAAHQPGQVRRADRTGQRRELPARRRRHRAGQRRADLPVQVKEPQQRPQPRHRRLRRRHAAPGALAADEPRHARGGQNLRASAITQGRPGQEPAGYPRITADTVPGQAPLPGQVLPEPHGQPVSRRLQHRHPRRRRRAQAAQVTQQRSQRPGRPQCRVTISAARGEKLPGQVLIQRCRSQSLRLKPAAQMRHQVDLMRGRAPAITLAEQLLPEPLGIRGQRPPDMATS